MKLILQRVTETAQSIIGKLAVDNQPECVTLEPARTNPVHAGHPCVAAGTYDLTFSVSPHLGYRTPELVAVPGRSDIRIHCGNQPSDSLGCILVGEESDKPNWINNSKLSFGRLMTLLNSSTEPHTISILDPPDPTPTNSSAGSTG